MQVIPAIDLESGRSRIVYWPGAAAGIGAPTDRPDRIAERFVALGARLIHLVDFDGARAGAPVNLEAVGAVASRVAVPLQLAGGVDSADGIRLAFAAGATRVVLTTAIADRPDDLRACLAVAGDWLAVGLDPRPERLAAFPWHRAATRRRRSMASSASSSEPGSHASCSATAAPTRTSRGPAELVRSYDAEILVAGGVRDLDGLRRLRDTGVHRRHPRRGPPPGAIDFSTAPGGRRVTVRVPCRRHRRRPLTRPVGCRAASAAACTAGAGGRRAEPVGAPRAAARRPTARPASPAAPGRRDADRHARHGPRARSSSRSRPTCRRSPPATSWRSRRAGSTTGRVFHRTPTLQDGTPFVIQGGDPTGTGTGGPGYRSRTSR